MTQQIVLVDNQGEIVQSFSSGPNNFIEGSIYNGYTVRKLPSTINVKEFRKTHYHSGAWIERPAPPSSFYVWRNGAWALDQETLDKEIRAKRNRLLTNSDWTQVPDSPLSESSKQAWAAYRQSLRDFPEVNTGIDWEDIVWPTQP